MRQRFMFHGHLGPHAEKSQFLTLSKYHSKFNQQKKNETTFTKKKIKIKFKNIRETRTALLFLDEDTQKSG